MKVALIMLIVIATLASRRELIGAPDGTSSDRAKAGGVCRLEGEPLLTGLRIMMNDPETQEVRDSLSLPTLADSLIRLVTQDSICVLAASAYTSRIGDAGTNRRVYVAELGPELFAVVDPQAVAGEWVRMIIFNRSFQFHAEAIW